MANAGTQVHFMCSNCACKEKQYILYYIFKFIYIIIYINYIKRYNTGWYHLILQNVPAYLRSSLPCKIGCFERYVRIWWIVHENFVGIGELSHRW